ncbi:MAG TPA: hypothetical protein PLL92_01035 [Alicycliphilus sp.]|nr:hypothetical protein [Alicycliphilus sp.]
MKILKSIFASTVVLGALVACGGGGGSSGGQPGKALLTTAPSPVTLLPGSSSQYGISGGVPPYRVGNSDTAIAVGAVSGTSLMIGAVNAGNSLVNVIDNAGTTVGVTVNVGSSIPLTSTAPESLAIGVGQASTRTFTVRGGVPPYTVEGSDGNVLTAAKVGANQFSVTGVAIGTGIVTVTDAANTKLGVAVKVGAPELRVSPTEMKIFPSIPAVVKISGGQPPYHVAGGIPDAIKATITGDEMSIEGQLASELEISVADATGQLQKVKVTVAIGQAQFGITPGALSITEEDDQPVKLQIFGAAAGPVCVFTDKTVLQPKVPGCTTDRVITLETGTAGSRCVDGDTDVTVTAVDKNGSIGTSVVTIRDLGKLTGACAKAFAVTPSVVTVKVGGTTQALLTGGSGSYVVSSLGGAASGTASGKVVTITGVAAGSATLTIFDQKDATRSVSITVNVTP